MKKGMAVIVALAIGACCCPSGVTVEAAQKEEIEEEDTGSRQESYILNRVLPSETDWDKAYEFMNRSVSGAPEMDPAYLDAEGMRISAEGQEETDQSGDTDYKDGELSGDVGKAGREELGAKTLQIPQKIEVTIDPWEVDGKGQIYSEQYIIQNTGDGTGILTLSGLTCRPQEGSSVSVRMNRDGIHEDERKSIYMEMLFGTGERIVLSEEGSEYKIELRPDEEVTLEFAGELNEHASVKWDNRDITVEVTYSWKLKEGTADSSGDAVEDVSGDVSGDMPKNAAKRIADASGDAAMAEPDVDVQEPSDGSSKADRTEFQEDGGLKDGGSGKEGPKAVEIDLSEEAEIHVDSWIADGNGNFVSIQYVMRNTGNVPGTLKLSDPLCRLADESGTIVRMKLSGGEKPENTEEPDGKTIWFELTAEEGEPSVTKHENLEISEYEAKLEPGEEIVSCFYVSFDDIMEEELKDGKAEVTVGYSWKLEEDAASGS